MSLLVLSLWEKTSAVRERRQSALAWLRNWATPALEWSWSGLPAWAWGKGSRVCCVEVFGVGVEG